MGTPVYVLIKSISGTNFVDSAKDIPGVRYVATAVGAFRGIAVLDLGKFSDVDGVLHKLEGSGAVPPMHTLRPTAPCQLKFAAPDHDAFIAVKMASLSDVRPVQGDIEKAVGAKLAPVVTSDAVDILVEVRAHTDSALNKAVSRVVAEVGNRGTTGTSVVANKSWKGPPA